MECIFIFDNLNDVIYSKYNCKFAVHLQKLCIKHGLISPKDSVVNLTENIVDNNGEPINMSNMIIQLFSPLVTSQRIMSTQFGNSYTSLQCQNGTNMAFDEYMGFLCMCIGEGPVFNLQHQLSICISLVRHVCGLDVAELKRNQRCKSLLDRLLDTWSELRLNDQACLVEALEQLSVNLDVTSSAINTLREACDSLRTAALKAEIKFDCSRSHAVILVDNKLLALYSSRGAEDLSPSDIIFLNILANSCRSNTSSNSDYTANHHNRSPPSTSSINTELGITRGGLYCTTVFDGKNSKETSQESVDIGSNNNAANETNIDKSQESVKVKEVADVSNHHVNESKNGSNHLSAATQLLFNDIVLLKGRKVLVPHCVHLYCPTESLTIALLYQICNESLCSGFEESFTALLKFGRLIGGSENEIELQKRLYESLENGMKRIMDGLKKIKGGANKQHQQQQVTTIDSLSKQLLFKWDQIKKKYNECVKSNEEVGINLSACLSNLLSSLQQLYRITCMSAVVAPFSSKQNLPVEQETVMRIIEHSYKSLFEFMDFFEAKAHHNFTLRSALLTINKYLEEFPGLVHFMYIDRNSHKVTAPFLQFSSEETNLLTKKKIWEMVELSRIHLRDGHLAFMWKDTTFNYAYYLWFEDSTAAPLKPKINPANAIKSLPMPMPGILSGDFYKCLIDACFPKSSDGKVRCFELYCVHLGLATSACVLDHSRRIAATVWEVSGQRDPITGNSTDLF